MRQRIEERRRREEEAEGALGEATNQVNNKSYISYIFLFSGDLAWLCTCGPTQGRMGCSRKPGLSPDQDQDL